MSLLLRNGFIHTADDPFATAVLIEDQTISWVGSEETADAMVKATTDPEHTVEVDLAGALVVPAFIDGLSTQAPDVTTGSEDRQLVSMTTEAESVEDHNAVVRYGPIGSAAAQWWIPHQEIDDGLTQLLEHSDRTPAVQALIGSRSPHELDKILSRLEGADAGWLMRSRHRVVANHPLSAEQIQRMRATQLSLTVTPLCSDTPELQAPLADVVAAGIHLSLGSGDDEASRENMWRVVTAAVEHPDPAQRLSTRAAFHAVTRNGVRVLPSVISQRLFQHGRISVGSPARLGVFTGTELGVQVPDETSAQFSTDARAGSALLPIVDSATPLPQRQATVVGEDYRG